MKTISHVRQKKTPVRQQHQCRFYGAYSNLWDQQSRVRYGSSYADLPEKLQKYIRKEIPLIISEAEPTEYGDSRKADKW